MLSLPMRKVRWLIASVERTEVVSIHGLIGKEEEDPVLEVQPPNAVSRRKLPSVVPPRLLLSCGLVAGTLAYPSVDQVDDLVSGIRSS